MRKGIPALLLTLSLLLCGCRLLPERIPPAGLTNDERRDAYNCDITYITNNELGFDYLRDNMVIYKEQLVQRGLHYAIIDEVDSVLIDEARTPLIISGQSGKSTKLYEACDILAQLTRGEDVPEYSKMDAIMGIEQEETGDFIVNEKDKLVNLTQQGVEKVEKFFHDLNETAERTMCVLKPVKLVITNYPEGQSEEFEVENNPNRPEDGTRKVTFSRELYIEETDFMEEPVKKYQRLYPGNEVRIKSAYIVKCTGCKKDENGNVVEVYAEYDPETKGGNTPDGRKVRGTIHWVDANNCLDAEVRLYSNT